METQISRDPQLWQLSLRPRRNRVAQVSSIEMTSCLGLNHHLQNLPLKPPDVHGSSQILHSADPLRRAVYIEVNFVGKCLTRKTERIILNFDFKSQETASYSSVHLHDGRWRHHSRIVSE